MQSICDAVLCTGCEGCLNICPQKAISMKGDEYGFLRPVIDNNSCIECGHCLKVCPAEKNIDAVKPEIVYAVYSKNNKDRDSSASGGASSVLASWFVNQGGVVYGCSQENVEKICHIRIDKEEDLNRIKGSKYVQSRIGNCYKKVKEDLQNGLGVMFFGTPCQVAALKSFMNGKCDNLWLVDICCHGVPSQKLMLDNVNLIKRNYGIKIDNSKLRVAFRRKLPTVEYGLYLDSFELGIKPDIQFGSFFGGGDDHSMRLVYENKVNRDCYITGFLNGVFFRPSCYQCKYARPERPSDLTLADFWGLGTSDNPEMNAQRGVSAVLINTEKGAGVFNSIEDKVIYEKRELSEVINGNTQLRHPFEQSLAHDVFMKVYPKTGWENACRKSFGRQMKKERVKDFFRSSALFTSIYRKIRYGK